MMATFTNQNDVTNFIIQCANSEKKFHAIALCAEAGMGKMEYFKKAENTFESSIQNNKRFFFF